MPFPLQVNLNPPHTHLLEIEFFLLHSQLLVAHLHLCLEKSTLSKKKVKCCPKYTCWKTQMLSKKSNVDQKAKSCPKKSDVVQNNTCSEIDRLCLEEKCCPKNTCWKSQMLKKTVGTVKCWPKKHMLEQSNVVQDSSNSEIDRLCSEVKCCQKTHLGTVKCWPKNICQKSTDQGTSYGQLWIWQHPVMTSLSI